VEKNVNDLHMKPCDAVEHSEWRKRLEGTGVKEAMPVMNTNCTCLVPAHPGLPGFKGC